jgi:hypothetical protein
MRNAHAISAGVSTTALRPWCSAGEHNRIVYRPTSVPAKLPERPRNRQPGSRRSAAARASFEHPALPAVPEDLQMDLEALKLSQPSSEQSGLHVRPHQPSPARRPGMAEGAYGSQAAGLRQYASALHAMVAGHRVPGHVPAGAGATLLEHAVASSDGALMRLLSDVLRHAWQATPGGEGDTFSEVAAVMLGALCPLCASRLAQSSQWLVAQVMHINVVANMHQAEPAPP